MSVCSILSPIYLNAIAIVALASLLLPGAPTGRPILLSCLAGNWLTLKAPCGSYIEEVRWYPHQGDERTLSSRPSVPVEALLEEGR